MFKKLKSKKNKRYKYKESALKPNMDLAIDSFSEYQNVFEKERCTGFKGLRQAFEMKSVLKLVIQTEDGQEEVTGIISHYDELYSQLVMVFGSSLKRLTFDKIIDVDFLEGE